MEKGEDVEDCQGQVAVLKKTSGGWGQVPVFASENETGNVLDLSSAIAVGLFVFVVNTVGFLLMLGGK